MTPLETPESERNQLVESLAEGRTRCLGCRTKMVLPGPQLLPGYCYPLCKDCAQKPRCPKCKYVDRIDGKGFHHWNGCPDSPAHCGAIHPETGFACTVSSTAHPGHTVHQAFNRNDVFLLREPTSADRHHQPYEEWTA